MPKPVDAIGPGDVLAVLSPHWSTKRETMRRVRQRIGAVMKHAIAEGHRESNPVDAIGSALPKNGVRKAHHKALPHGEVGAALATVRESGAWWATKAAFELTVLTAARGGEVRGMEWPEIEGDVWTVPGERMKAGHDHRVPLSGRALEILADAREHGDGSGLVAGSRRHAVRRSPMRRSGSYSRITESRRCPMASEVRSAIGAARLVLLAKWPRWRLRMPFGTRRKPLMRAAIYSTGAET